MGFQVDEPWHCARSVDGRLKITALEDYKISDIDESTATAYYGFLDKDGSWYIMEVTATTVRYFAGTTGYATNWTGREDLEYGYYDAVF